MRAAGSCGLALAMPHGQHARQNAVRPPPQPPYPIPQSPPSPRPNTMPAVNAPVFGPPAEYRRWRSPGCPPAATAWPQTATGGVIKRLAGCSQQRSDSDRHSQGHGRGVTEVECKRQACKMEGKSPTHWLHMSALVHGAVHRAAQADKNWPTQGPPARFGRTPAARAARLWCQGPPNAVQTPSAAGCS